MGDNNYIYCLWGSCKKFDPKRPELCLNDEYIVTNKPLCSMSLEEAKKKYPNTKFCEDWEKEECKE